MVIEVSDLQASGKLCKVGRLATQVGKLKIATAAGGKKALAPAVGSGSAAKANKAGGSTSAKARAKVAAGKDAKEANDAQLGGKISKLQATPSYVASSDC